MPATVRATANDILNRVAAELGLDQVTNPFSSTDKSFIQLKALLNIAGEELLALHDWNFLTREHSITTTALDTGDYDLPTDYHRMINQTGWERTNSNPLAGPLSPQEWQCLEASDVTSTIYVSFRIREGEFSVFPQPPEAGLNIRFEYVAKNWVIDSTDGTTLIGGCVQGADTPLFDKTLISRYLKVKFLEAKNLDTTKAQADLNQMFGILTASDKGAPILNMAGRRGTRFLGAANIPDTNFGS